MGDRLFWWIAAWSFALTMLFWAPYFWPQGLKAALGW
jgi:hypothetical protein